MSLIAPDLSFPDFFGTRKVQDAIKNFLDREEINRNLHLEITKPLNDVYRSANNQIQSPKATFHLPNSQGLLVILNDSVDILTPESLVHRLRQIASKTAPDGSYQYQHINSVLLISEAHFTPQGELMGFPLLHIEIEPITKFLFGQTLDNFFKEWSKFEGVPLFETSLVDEENKPHFQSLAEHKMKTRTVMSRQDTWALYYGTLTFAHSVTTN